MSKVTTLSIGGPAKDFVKVKSEEQLINAVEGAKISHQPFMVMGGGSNLLVSDEGVKKLVIKNEVSGITQRGDEIIVKSGTPLQDLVDFTISHRLLGLQKLTGIPGTVGGAVFGNAGAYGQTIADYIVSVVAFDGHKKTLSKKDCGFDYRDSRFKRNGLIILEIKFQLPPGDFTTLKKEAEETLKKRLKKYLPGVKCPGSFFKNLLVENVPVKVLDQIPNVKDYYGKVPAWYFLEGVGAKGKRLGKIKIADYHANLFINEGGGKAADFYNLAKKYALQVEKKFGIKLEPEVQLINLPPI